MKFKSATLVAAFAAIALMVDSGVAFGMLDGLGLLQSYYGGGLPIPTAPAPPMPLAMPPMFAAPPPPPPPPPCAPMVLPPPPPPPPPPPACGCASCCEKSCCHHPSCLSYLKPCLHAKLLNLKKKLIEKKLTSLLACCAHYNSHLCPQQQCC